MKTYTVGVEFIETDPRAGKPHACRRTWEGPAESEQDAMNRCCEFYGFEKDGIEITDIRILDQPPPEE